MDNYKVCILAGGSGRRMNSFTRYFNKAMLPLQGKPVINHIIEKFPEKTDIVISISHFGDELKEYVTTAYPNRKLTFIEDDKSKNNVKGPGYGLLQCKSSLQIPFVLSAVDTMVLEDVPTPDVNWFGLARVSNIERFCSAEVSNGKVKKLEDKVETSNEFAFIGLAGIRDYELFWDALESNRNIIGGEIQVSNGFVSLIPRNLYAKLFTWFDVGTPSSYDHALKNYPLGNPYRGE